MTFKTQWYREKFAKKRDKGFCGYPVATVAFYGPDDARATKVSVGIVTHEDRRVSRGGAAVHRESRDRRP